MIYIGFFAIKNIEVNEELTYDYNNTNDGIEYSREDKKRKRMEVREEEEGVFVLEDSSTFASTIPLSRTPCLCKSFKCRKFLPKHDNL